MQTGQTADLHCVMYQQTIKTRALCFGRAAPNPGAAERKEAELCACFESVLVAQDALDCFPVS